VRLPPQVPAAWAPGPLTRGTDASGFDFAAWAGLTDPVVGTTADGAVLRARPAPQGVASVADFGPQENINPARVFGLAAAVPELARADITRASKRRGAAPAAAAAPEGAAAGGAPAPAGGPPAEGPLFYEWELAVPPEYCAYNTGCNSAAVYFLSVTVDAGVLCVLALTQTREEQYRLNAGKLRAARLSFVAADGAAALAEAAAREAREAAPRGAPAADPGVIVAAP
jgi:hypothetical protein